MYKFHLRQVFIKASYKVYLKREYEQVVFERSEDTDNDLCFLDTFVTPS